MNLSCRRRNRAGIEALDLDRDAQGRTAWCRLPRSLYESADSRRDDHRKQTPGARVRHRVREWRATWVKGSQSCNRLCRVCRLAAPGRLASARQTESKQELKLVAFYLHV